MAHPEADEERMMMEEFEKSNVYQLVQNSKSKYSFRKSSRRLSGSMHDGFLYVVREVVCLYLTLKWSFNVVDSIT